MYNFFLLTFCVFVKNRIFVLQNFTAGKSRKYYHETVDESFTVKLWMKVLSREHDFYINYLRKGGNVFAGFCLFVCLSVSQQDNSKSYGRIFLKF